MPNAPPLMIVTPARAAASANFCATAFPYVVAARVPTMASVGANKQEASPEQ
jgi:hypothetical protein